jgi:hypothetical protein
VAETVLYPKVGKDQPERMASPIILKPLALEDGRAVSAIVPLVSPWFTQLELTRDGRNNILGTFPPSAVQRADLATYPNSPLAGSPSGSAIEAFLTFVQNTQNQFRSV